jgi:hypothetical protein
MYFKACLLLCLLLGLSTMAIAMANVPTATVTRASITSADGVHSAYDIRGGADADTTVYFVHCWACNRLFWKNQTDVFSSRYRVVTVDLAGHGRSGTDQHNWTADSLAQDVAQVANACGPTIDDSLWPVRSECYALRRRRRC